MRFIIFYGLLRTLFLWALFKIDKRRNDSYLPVYNPYLLSLYFYRPQRSCGKVMFSQACLKNSVHREGVYPSMHWGRHLPLPSACWDTHPPGQTPIPLSRHPHVQTPLPAGQTPLPPGRHPSPWVDTPPPWADTPPRWPLQGASRQAPWALQITHPTGMHSCTQMRSDMESVCRRALLFLILNDVRLMKNLR